MELCRWHDYIRTLRRHLLIGEGLSRGGRRDQLSGRGSEEWERAGQEV